MSISHVFGILQDTLSIDPARPVLVPGEIEMNQLVRQRRDGIVLDAQLIRKLEQLAAEQTAAR